MKAANPAISLEELDLVEQARQGNADAYGRLVTKYQARVFNTCLRLCGNRADAEDCTQEAFMKALRAINTFEGHSQFSTWVFRIAMNVVLSAKRKSRNRRALSLDAALSDRDSENSGRIGAAIPSGDCGPHEDASRRDMLAVVQEALASLELEHRTVVVLRDIESFDYTEIAEILGVPTGTVKSRLHRARMALRDKLSSHLQSE